MIKQMKSTYGNWSTTNETLVYNYLQFFFCKIRQVHRLCRSAMTLYYKRYKTVYVNIINRKFIRQNIIIYVIMNLHYGFVIIKCNSLLQNYSLSNVKHAV